MRMTPEATRHEVSPPIRVHGCSSHPGSGARLLHAPSVASRPASMLRSTVGYGVARRPCGRHGKPAPHGRGPRGRGGPARPAASGPFAGCRDRDRTLHGRRPGRDATASRPGRPVSRLGVTGADCGTVLFADAATGVVGACHAGWKGAFTGVVEVDGRKPCWRSAPTRHAGSYGRSRPDHRAGLLRGRPRVQRRASCDADAALCDLLQRSRHGRTITSSTCRVSSATGRGAPGSAVSRISRLDTYADETLFYSYRRATQSRRSRLWPPRRRHCVEACRTERQVARLKPARARPSRRPLPFCWSLRPQGREGLLESWFRRSAATW